jgi:hypothetical protein
MPAQAYQYFSRRLGIYTEAIISWACIIIWKKSVWMNSSVEYIVHKLTQASAKLYSDGILKQSLPEYEPAKIIIRIFSIIKIDSDDKSKNTVKVKLPLCRYTTACKILAKAKRHAFLILAL